MKEYSKEEIQRLVERDQRSKRTQQRQWVKSLLLVQKAKAKGIVVTDAEIDEYIKNKAK